MDEDILNKIIELAKRYNVSKLVQFGSSLDSYDSRDVDLACDGLYDKRFFRFGSELEELIKKPVDLVPLQPADKFTEYITKHGKVIYESES